MESLLGCVADSSVFVSWFDFSLQKKGSFFSHHHGTQWWIRKLHSWVDSSSALLL